MTSVTEPGYDNVRHGAAGPRSPLHDILSGYPQPLPNRPPSDRFDLAIAERAFLGKVAVLGSGEAFHANIAGWLGFSLPQAPNSTETHGDITAMWLSPNEWMLVTSPERGVDLTVSLQQVLVSIHALVVDVSDRWTVVAIAGTRVLSVLSKGTSVRLEPAAFGVGRCCQTRLFSMPVIIRQSDATPTFDIFVDSTFSEYLWRWLERSADGLDVHVFATPA